MRDPVKATKSMEDKFFDWMAKTRTGTMFKVGISAALIWAIDDISNWGIPPVAMVVGTAVMTMLINQVNPRDGRYGFTSKSGDSDGE